MRYNAPMLSRDAITINGHSLEQAERETRFGEAGELEIACPPVPDARAAGLRIGDVELGPPSSTLGDPRWRWRWQPSFAAGVHPAQLRVVDRDGAVHLTRFELRIAPSRLDAECYERLIRELQHDVAGLVWALAGGRVGATPLPAQQRGLLEEGALLVQRQAREAADVCDSIVARPHERLHSEPAPVALADARRIDPPALADLAREPLDEVRAELIPRLQQALRPARQSNQGSAGADLLPRRVLGERTRSTLDLAEHRLLRRVLETIVWRLEYIAGMLRRELERRSAGSALPGVGPSPAVLDERSRACSGLARGLRRRLELPFFASVGAWRGPAASHLLRRDPRYRRLGRLYRELRMAPFAAFDCAALFLPIAELPLLYEQWCVVRLSRALLPLGALVRQELVSVDDGSGRESRWTLRLRTQHPLLELRLPDGGRVVLRYQRRYAPAGREELGTLDSYVRIPDAAVELTRGDTTRALIFDAKYRVDADGRAPQDALDDAYAYRGAIGVGQSRATLGSFLLFPGTVALETADHIGALPLVPGGPDNLTPLLRRLLGI